jgi:hypothetical protein
VNFKVFLFFSLLGSAYSHADFLITPRLDSVAGEEILAQRGILKTKADFKGKRWGFFFEGFAEYDMADSIKERRSPSKGYLNEAFVEYQKGSFFLKLGKQSFRWSEMWIVPSLDLWTSRRYQRLYWDPFVDQMEHSAGLSASLSGKNWSWDFAVFPEVSEDQFPEPVPVVKKDNPPLSFGGRFKFTPEQVGLSFMGAQKHDETWLGVQPSLAFEQFVVKGEWGLTNFSEKDPWTPNREQNFLSLGFDFFLDQWTITPQATVNRINEIGGRPDTTEALYYFGLNWLKGKHDLQFQAFHASLLQEGFAGISYGYAWTDHLILTGFVQTYDGQLGSLHRIYKDLVGGTAFGARAEFPFGF